MAEYMDYNDYDYGYKTRRKKIFANIRLVIAILFIVGAVVFTITNLPDNVRTDYDPVYSSTHKIGEKIKTETNEFVSFNKKFKDEDMVNFNADFEKEYPEIYKLAHMPKKEITKQKVKTFDNGDGYFVLAYTYEVTRQKDANGNYYDDDKEYIIGTTGVDFYIFKYDLTDALTIYKPERFSIRLYTGQNDLVPYIQKVYISSDRFRLNFYSLSVVVQSDSEFSELTSTVSFESGINKSQYDNEFFTKQQFIKSDDNQDLIGKYNTTDGGQRGDMLVENEFLIKSPVKKAIIGINFDDAVYNKFASYKLSGVKGAVYTIKVN